jgi:hypothetical protein
MTSTPTARVLAVALCMAALGAAVPPAQAKDAAEPVTVAADFDAAAQAGTLLKVTEPQALKGLSRVGVSQFSVQFITADSASAETSGFAAAGRARVSASYQLQGVGEPEFQALAETLHAEFVKSLQASGLEVLPFAQIAAAPAYARLAATGVTLPTRNDSSVTVGPAGMASFGVNRAVAENPSKGSGLAGAFSGFGSVVSAIGSAGDAQALSKELGDAALLEVHMVVNFVELTNNNRGFFGRMSTTASVGAKTAPSVGKATLGVQVGAQRSTFTLSQALALDPGAFSAVREKAKTTGETAGAIAVAVLAFAVGSKDSSSSSAFEAVADPVRYREVVGGGLGQVGKMFTARLKAER